MTNPITEPTQSIRERLARVACFADECCWSRERPCGSPADCDTFEEQCPIVDAILSELEKPSEGMVTAAVPVAGQAARTRATNDYRAMIQHIRDGGK